MRFFSRSQHTPTPGKKEIGLRPLDRYLNATLTSSEKDEFRKVPDVCYMECAEPHVTDRPTDVCRLERNCELVKKYGHPVALRNGRLRAKQSRRARRKARRRKTA